MIKVEVIFMLHNEARHLIIQALNHHTPVKEIAECFSVNTSTIYRLRKQLEMTGSVETRTSLRGRKPILSDDDIVHIDNLIQAQPDITIHEIMDTLHLKVSDETIRQAVIKLGYVYKKKSLHASEQERPRHPAETGKHLVFLDESGINTDMTRRYARAKKDQRAVDSTPLNTPATTTILSSIRLDGSCIYTTYQGGTTAERFESYLESDLLPTLGPDDIVVMDNMRSHHAKTVKNLLDEKHIQYLYLPPYSPDYNPIENMWSKIKANMRKQKVRTAALLSEAIRKAFSTIRISDCMGWFRACGYVQ